MLQISPIFALPYSFYRGPTSSPLSTGIRYYKRILWDQSEEPCFQLSVLLVLMWTLLDFSRCVHRSQVDEPIVHTNLSAQWSRRGFREWKLVSKFTRAVSKLYRSCMKCVAHDVVFKLGLGVVGSACDWITQCIKTCGFPMVFWCIPQFVKPRSQLKLWCSWPGDRATLPTR